MEVGDGKMKQRNANIELLRVLSMFMVLVLHALNWSGALNYTSGIHYWVYWWMEALAIVAVNVFMLISGYFQINGLFKAKNVWKILGGVWSYSLLFSLVNCWIAGTRPGMMELARMLLPIITKKFWFVNSYLAVYLISPFVNKMLHAITRKQLNVLAAILVALFSLRVTILPITWAQDSTGGMGILWLATLYVVGAWLRITGWGLRKNSYHGWIYLLMSAVLVVSKGVLLRIGIPESYAGKLYGYPSVVVLIESVALFLFFVNKHPIEGQAAKCICSISKHSFAVYIIHFAMVGTVFTKVAHLDKIHSNVLVFVPVMLGVCVVLFLFCVCVDWLREILFSKIRQAEGIEWRIGLIDQVMNGRLSEKGPDDILHTK